MIYSLRWCGVRRKPAVSLVADRWRGSYKSSGRGTCTYKQGQWRPKTQSFERVRKIFESKLATLENEMYLNEMQRKLVLRKHCM